MEGATSETVNNVLIYFLSNVLAPPRMAGDLLLVHETMDQVKEPRRAWTYNPGQRRVRRAPNVAYDLPTGTADGQRTADMLDMYNGAPDRYEWSLIGKKEMYIPYNSYKVGDRQVKYKDIIRPGHPNPDLLRYELHRVWHVEAKLRQGTRHIYAQTNLLPGRRYVDNPGGGSLRQSGRDSGGSRKTTWSTTTICP